MTGAALSHYASASQRRLDLIGRSLRSLSAGMLHEAYVLADMACRSRVPAADDLLLRGEIAARLGCKALERDDIDAAFAIDPSAPATRLRMLEALQRRGDAQAADAVARAILRLEPQMAVIGAVIAALKPGAGSHGIAWSQASQAGLKILVFSAKRQSFAIELGFEGHDRRLQVEALPEHALASVRGAAGSVEIAWPEGAQTARFTSEPALDWTGPPAFRPFHPGPTVQRRQPGWRKGPVEPVTVIMPVYGDVAATRIAIDAVLSARSTLPQRLVLVDDCGPDPAMRALLADYALRPHVAVISNPINLGFIGSVNRALSQYPDGDVVLLNADTIVAPGWLERLSRAAHSQPGIGTATPLSNNGELTSVPAPFERTEMPDIGEVALIDTTVSELNPGRTVELPNGVGFCLYITQACRDATGLLNDADYREGYLEEVDYCLRASERGFSHVCACDVFVGHAGSRSFQARKRGLVMHNLARLECTFPGVGAATQAFITSDPLRQLRFTLQKRLLASAPTPRRSVTLIVGRQAIAAAGAPDVPALAKLSRDRSLLRLSFSGAAGTQSAMLHRDGAMAPHRLPINLAGDDPLADLLDLIRGQAVARIVYLDAHHPRWARELPRLLAVGYDVRAVDDSVVCAAGDAGEWADFLKGARRFVSTSSILSDLASRLGVRRPDHEPLRFAPAIAIERAEGPDAPEAIAIFLNKGDTHAWRWIQEMGRAIMRQRWKLRLVVFGATLDEDGLRRTGAVTVTGMPSEALASATFALHHCVATIALLPTGAVEHPALSIMAQSPRPLLSWNPYLPDVLGCRPGESAGFTPDQPAQATLTTLIAMLGGRHG